MGRGRGSITQRLMLVSYGKKEKEGTVEANVCYGDRRRKEVGKVAIRAVPPGGPRGQPVA